MQNDTASEVSEFRQVKAKWPGNLDAMRMTLCALFQRRGRNECDAADEADAVTLELSRLFGGRAFYFPFGSHMKSALREARIAGEFNGTNYAEIAERHALAESSVRRIIARHIARARQARNEALGEVRI